MLFVLATYLYDLSSQLSASLPSVVLFWNIKFDTMVVYLTYFDLIMNTGMV
jgi:hypothetical protein